MSKPADAAARQEIERKRIKREIQEALNQVADLRAKVRQIEEHYATAHPQAKS